MAVKIYDGSDLELGIDRNFYVRDTSSITEQAGYVNAETQVTRLIAAGVNLMDFRRQFYDYPDGEVPSDAKPDPTMSVGFDLADADMIMSDLSSKAKKKAASVKVTVEGESVGGTEESAPKNDSE